MGTSTAPVNPSGAITDHPHACGDKHCFADGRRYSMGSSPRVWGQVKSEIGIFDTYRLIPPRVGTSLASIPQVLTKKDHPHACGDKYSFAGRLIKTPGSSPRVWGQAKADINNDRNIRIIPTRVGTRALLTLLCGRQ